MDMNKHLIDFFIDLQNISQRKPLNKCMFCRLNIEKIDFIFNNDKEKIEVKIKYPTWIFVNKKSKVTNTLFNAMIDREV